MDYYSSYLLHYGVKGMKWGVRRKAKKDAKEFARAKMFYGEGAGTRRKLIKAKVNERSKDPYYKKEFDKALESQNMEKHAQKAKKERTKKDAVKKVKKTSRGLFNIATGHPERAGAALASVAMAYGIAHKTGLDKKILQYGKEKYSEFTRTKAYRDGWDKAQDILNRVRSGGF